MELGEDVVEAVYADRTTAPVSDRLKAGLAIVDRITANPDEFGRPDVEAARAAGLSDADIADAVDVAALFALINRLTDAFAFAIPDAKGFRRSGRYILKNGYRSFFPPVLWPRP